MTSARLTPERARAQARVLQDLLDEGGATMSTTASEVTQMMGDVVEAIVEGELPGMPQPVPAPRLYGREYRTVQLALSGGVELHVTTGSEVDLLSRLQPEHAFDLHVSGEVTEHGFKTKRDSDGIPQRVLVIKLKVDSIQETTDRAGGGD
jgi:hypothetical protein